MNRYVLMLAVLALLASPVFAETYKVVAHVSDSDGRPVQGASAVFHCHEEVSNAIWEKGKMLPREWAMDDTDSLGATDMATWQCTLGQPAWLTVTYHGQNISVDVGLHSGTNTVNAVVPDLFDLDIAVVDQDQNPIAGVNITGTPSSSGPLKTLYGATDDAGKAVFRQIPAGSDYILRMKNGDEEKSSEVEIGNEDSVFEVQMSSYAFKVQVVDDLNSSIVGATVNVSCGGKYISRQTDAAGDAAFSGLKPATYSVVTSYSSKMQESEVKLDKDVKERVVFDIHGPAISDIRVEEKGTKEPLYVFAKATDSGSGLKEVRMYYSLNKAAWSEMPVTLTGSGEYRGSIPSQGQDTQISYKVSALDAALNKAEEEKVYVVGNMGCLPALILPVLPFVGMWFTRRNGKCR